MSELALERPSNAARTLLADDVTPEPYSREYFLARLGPELVADVLAKVAAAPPPSPAKVAEVRRLFAAVPLKQAL